MFSINAGANSAGSKEHETKTFTCLQFSENTLLSITVGCFNFYIILQMVFGIKYKWLVVANIKK